MMYVMLEPGTLRFKRWDVDIVQWIKDQDRQNSKMRAADQKEMYDLSTKTNERELLFDTCQSLPKDKAPLKWLHAFDAQT